MRLLSVLSLALLAAGAAGAETRVELKGVHLCCRACVTGVENALKGSDVQVQCDQKARTVVLTAPSAESARKAVAKLAAAGYHGESGDPAAAMPAVAGVPTGKVQKLTVRGVHNCCGRCATELKELLRKVDGVDGDTVKPRAREFEVTGDFEAGAVVKALTAAGFHPTAVK
jgi:mercuric ion binding protein